LCTPRPLRGENINILFWNTNIPNADKEKTVNINESLVEIVLENNIDFISLAEYGADIQRLCNKLNSVSKKQYNLIPISKCDRIVGLLNTYYPVTYLNDETRYIIIKTVIGSKELIIATIHNISKLRYEDEDARLSLHEFHEDIIKYEIKSNCNHTLAIKY